MLENANKYFQRVVHYKDLPRDGVKSFMVQHYRPLAASDKHGQMSKSMPNNLKVKINCEMINQTNNMNCSEDTVHHCTCFLFWDRTTQIQSIINQAHS